MVLKNYQNLIEMTSNIFIIIAFSVGFKCPRKIYPVKLIESYNRCPLCGAKDEYYFCFHSSCQLGLRGKRYSDIFEVKLIFITG